MKKLPYLLFFIIPYFVTAQYDFDTRYFTINSESLAVAPKSDKKFETTKKIDEPQGTFTLELTPTFSATLKSLKINSSNYWEPVDMMDVVSTSNTYINPSWEVDPFESEFYGTSGYSADGATKVTNTVYSEVRGLDLLDPCPPIGICPRCAPYRYNARR